jgi:hypothetical protein
MFATPNLPFTVNTSDEVISVSIHPDAGQHPALFTRSSVDWVKEVRGGPRRMELDFSQIISVNSALVAWLFQLVQVGRIQGLKLNEASAEVVKQLKQFHLEHFISIVEEQRRRSDRLAALVRKPT